MTVIESELGIARSTLSNWFRGLTLTEDQQASLLNNSHIGLTNGRIKSVAWHNQQKAMRLAAAKDEADEVLDKIDCKDLAILDIAFAMLYWGEGTKKDVTSLGSSDPQILKFMLAALKLNYSITPKMVRCYLHLRADQDAEEMKSYWSSNLNIPISCFNGVSYDPRTSGRPTYPGYKGVCVIYCGNIAIQRKLFYLYNGFCERVEKVFNLGD